VTLDSNAITVPASGGGQQCNDFTTGGGFITSPSGGKATFGFVAGCKCGNGQGSSLRGELVYQDHGIDLTVKSTGVTAYLEMGPNSRRIQGTAEINGQTGAYQVDVTEGQSATASFTIRLSTGYSASGNLGSGDIEIHRCHNATP
jgi:hypothetical protein